MSQASTTSTRIKKLFIKMNLESFPVIIYRFITFNWGSNNAFFELKEGKIILPRNISLSFLFTDFLLIIGILFQKFNTSDSSLQLVEKRLGYPR